MAQRYDRGTKAGRGVVVEVYVEPFVDDDPRTVLDGHRGGWRDKDAG